MRSDAATRIRAAYEAFNEGRVGDWAAENVPANFELVPVAPIAGDGYIGPEGVVRFFADVAEAWESMRIEVEEIIEFGDRLVSLGRIHNRGRGSGMELDVVMAHVWTIEDGVLIRAQMIGDREEALRRAQA